MHDQIAKWLAGLVPKSFIEPIIIGGGVLLTLVASWLAYELSKRLLLKAITKVTESTETTWDDHLVERGVFKGMANLAPAVVIYLVLPTILAGYPTVTTVLRRLALIAMIIIGLSVASALLNAVLDIYQSFKSAKQIPIKAVIQVTKVVLYCVAAIILLALVLDKTPLYLLSGLGAFAAVLLIIFKDPILGLVAGIQLSANKMVAIGDWLEMPTHSADGEVIEIALTTVKVRNWDMTITTIPTYDLISKSFKNWRGMTESGGRRIVRSINIDLNTVGYADDATLDRLARIEILREYIETRRAEIKAYNDEQGIDTSCPVNGRHMTNIGTFRAYVAAYLRANPMIHKDMTFLVRLLEPTKHGVPIQIYVFTATTEWAVYEGIQADVFDHLMAAIPEFGLRAYQEPAGLDFRTGLSQSRSA
ncbi:MAG: mechanosensitive ion channel [Myxococcales bacterium]|nr:mechanosensitive ion channel [Myxococcales bacterium]